MSVPTGMRVQREGVADFGSGVRAADHCGAYLEAVGGDDIRFAAVYVVEKGDAGRTVGVVLDALYYGRYSVFVSLKVNDTVSTLVTATNVPGGEVTFGVAAAGGFLTDCKRFFRRSSSDGTFEYADNFVPLPGSCGLEFSYCHLSN